MAVFLFLLLLLLLLFDHPGSSLGCTGFSRVVAQRLSCPEEYGIFINSFPTGDWTHVLCVARSILNHWSTGKSLNGCIFITECLHSAAPSFKWFCTSCTSHGLRGWRLRLYYRHQTEIRMISWFLLLWRGFVFWARVCLIIQGGTKPHWGDLRCWEPIRFPPPDPDSCLPWDFMSIPFSFCQPPSLHNPHGFLRPRSSEVFCV